MAGNPIGRPGRDPSGQGREGNLSRTAPASHFAFSAGDRAQLRGLGISEERALSQLEIFRAGQKHIRLERACTLNDGILRLSGAEQESLAAAYSVAAQAGRALEFVPASGAATRMFKGLLAILNRSDRPAFAALMKEASQNADARETVEWFNGLRRFPFFAMLRSALARKGEDLEALMAAKEYRPILDCLLTPRGLDYSGLPKALIPFHAYPEGPHTALEEHLAEAAGLVQDRNGVCRLHFTVSREHEQAILSTLEDVRRKYEASGIRFVIDLSRQKASTDTLAVDKDNLPLRNADNTLYFRPGGHGALLENLFHTGGDIVFIKNIDNLVPARRRAEALAWRKALAGHLLSLADQTAFHLARLRGGPDADAIEAAARFAERRLNVLPPEALKAPSADPAATAAKADYLIKTLDRPMRVCAMVKNQGEPGGGPFWVRAPDGSLRAQIVETAQVEISQSKQRRILESATHFNPVDMVCALRNPLGEPYKLQDFVDRDACFITSKSKDGNTLKALELPGLWNGSMAFWNSVFVEMPVEAFNPVKTVNDLLRPSHQG